MNKHTVIAIIASIVILGTVGFTISNIFMIDQLQLRIANADEFSYFKFINEERLSVCNTSSFYTTFNELKITMVYEGRNIGEINFPGTLLEPNSDITKTGKFTTQSFEEVQYLSMHYDAMFTDTIPIRIDPANMVIITDIQTQLFGFIPYSVTNQYSAFEFSEMMNDEDYACAN